MELSWLVRIRIFLSLALGIGIVGFLAWPLVAPQEPMQIVKMPEFTAWITLISIAFGAGLLAGILSFPYSREIGILAVPAGLSTWALRSGSMSDYLRPAADAARRTELLAQIQWESFFWLLIIAVGFLGAGAGYILLRHLKLENPKDSNENFLNSLLRTTQYDLLSGKQLLPSDSEQKKTTEKINIVNGLIAAGITVFAAHFLIRIFVRNVSAQDAQLGSLVSQAQPSQIAFGVIAALFVSSFFMKGFFRSSYLWPILSTAFLTPIALYLFMKPEIVTRLFENWPVVYYPNASVAVTPLQVVSLGTLGCIFGFWAAIRYEFWKKHEL